jgi:hypothetical protein
MKTHISLLHASLIAALCGGLEQPLHAAQKAQQRQPEGLVAAQAQRQSEEAETEARRAEQQSRALTESAAKLSAEGGDIENLSKELSKIGPAVSSSMNTLNTFFKPARAESSRSLIILKDQADPKTQTDVEEDLTIMGRLLQKSLRDDSKQAMGITVYGGSYGGSFESSKAPRSMYLEGYGAIFTLGVNFPFMPAATAKEDAEPRDDKNAEWEEARRELHHPAESPTIFKWDQSFSSGVGAEEYDAQKVESLKNGLISALKNAVNIRKLKSDESVVIVVNGRSSATETKVVSSRGSGRASSNVKVVTPSNPDRRGTQMILRAKKSDLESFQKDKLSLEDLRKKVTISVN